MTYVDGLTILIFQPFSHILHILHDSCLSTSFTHQSYNALHSVNNLIRHTLPTVVNLILTDDSDQFGVRILRTLNEFVRRLFIMLMILGDYRPAKQFLIEMIAMGLERKLFLNFHLNGLNLKSSSCITLANRRGAVRAFQSRIIAAISRRLQTFQVE